MYHRKYVEIKILTKSNEIITSEEVFNIRFSKAVEKLASKLYRSTALTWKKKKKKWHNTVLFLEPVDMNKVN